MAYGFANLRCLIRGVALGIFAVLLLMSAGEDALAQEAIAQGHVPPAKRQAIFKARMVDIENLFTSGAPEDEVQDDVQRLRQLANLAEASLVEKAARLELLTPTRSLVEIGCPPSGLTGTQSQSREASP